MPTNSQTRIVGHGCWVRKRLKSKINGLAPVIGEEAMSLRNTILLVGEPVERDDGRFYVPVTLSPAHEDLSPIVLRIASDAFPDLALAKEFAAEVAARWNMFA